MEPLETEWLAGRLWRRRYVEAAQVTSERRCEEHRAVALEGCGDSGVDADVAANADADAGLAISVQRSEGHLEAGAHERRRLKEYLRLAPAVGNARRRVTPLQPMERRLLGAHRREPRLQFTRIEGRAEPLGVTG